MSLKRATPTATPQPNPKGPFLPEGLTIFLVDEDDAVRDALALSLRAAGHTVAAFGSAKEFFAAYRRGDPGCLVADIDFSDLGVAAVLRALVAAPAVLPAIITSRRLWRRVPLGGLPADRMLFLDKPFGSDELLGVIRIAMASASGSRPGP